MFPVPPFAETVQYIPQNPIAKLKTFIQNREFNKAKDLIATYIMTFSNPIEQNPIFDTLLSYQNNPTRIDDVYQLGMIMDEYNILTPFGRLCYMAAKLHLGHPDAFQSIQQTLQDRSLAGKLQPELAQWMENFSQRGNNEEPHQLFTKLYNAMHGIQNNPELPGLLFRIKQNFLSLNQVADFVKKESSFSIVESFCKEYSQVNPPTQLGNLLGILSAQMNAVRATGKLLPPTSLINAAQKV